MKRWIKVCGVTSVADAEVCVAAGVSAIGINLWPRSPRYVPVAQAATIAQACAGSVDVVVVCVDESQDTLLKYRDEIGAAYIQCHGDEPDSLLRALQPFAFKAVGLAGQQDVRRACAAPGPFVLVDAKDLVKKGGTGLVAPLDLARQVCQERPTVLAGGLNAQNVASLIAAVGPCGVDVASGVEYAPGKKELAQVRDFVQHAKDAFAALEQAS